MTIKVDTRQGQTAAAEDGAEDLTAAHVDGVVDTHTAGVVVLLAVVTSATEDVAVVGRGTRGAHDTVFVIGAHTAQDVAVLGTAEGAAPDAVDGIGCSEWQGRHGHVNRHISVVDIGDCIISSTAIRMGSNGDVVIANTLAAAKHVAVGAVQADFDVVRGILFGSRTHLTASNIHYGDACGVGVCLALLRQVIRVPSTVVFVIVLFSQAHASHFAAAIDAELHMAAADGDVGGVGHQGRLAVGDGIGNVALAAAEDRAAGLVVDAVQFRDGIRTVFMPIANRTHEACLHVDGRVFLHLAQLAAAVHVAGHFGVVDHHGAVFQRIEVHFGVGSRTESAQIDLAVDDTTAGAEDVAAVVEVSVCARVDHLADGAALDGHRASRFACLIGGSWDGRRAYGCHGTAAIHVAVNRSALDGHIGVEGDRTGRVAVLRGLAWRIERDGIDTTACAIDVAGINRGIRG